MDKEKLKEALLSMEHQIIDQTQVDYETYLSSTTIDAGQAIDDDDTSHLRQSVDVTDRLDHQIHDHQEHVEVLKRTDFSPTKEVRQGAVIKANDRYFVVSVPKTVFQFENKTFYGISTEAPIYGCMEGKKAGDICHFNNIEFKIQEVY